MDFVNIKNDSTSVWVHNNNIESALRLLRKQTKDCKSFKEIKKPRKSKHQQRRRQLKMSKLP